jgi:hypothetical protein
MKSDRSIRILHTIVTAQFAASAGLIIFWTLYQTRLGWWAIFSLSAQAIVIVLFGVLIYGFAVFRGTIGGRIEAEHPLSGSIYYRAFYVVIPILGGLVSGVDALLAGSAPLPARLLAGLRGCALGTVVSAYIVWLFVDTAVGIAESLLTEPRRLHTVRLAREKEIRDAARREKEFLLERVRADKKALMERLAPLIEKCSAEIASLLKKSADDPSVGAGGAATIGLEIWQAGGVDCMRELFRAVERECSARNSSHLMPTLDFWWDGVGNWRRSRVSAGA